MCCKDRVFLVRADARAYSSQVDPNSSESDTPGGFGRQNNETNMQAQAKVAEGSFRHRKGLYALVAIGTAGVTIALVRSDGDAFDAVLDRISKLPETIEATCLLFRSLYNIFVAASPPGSNFPQDVIRLLAQMALDESARQELVRAGFLDFLLKYSHTASPRYLLDISRALGRLLLNQDVLADIIAAHDWRWRTIIDLAALQQSDLALALCEFASKHPQLELKPYSDSQYTDVLMRMLSSNQENLRTFAIWAVSVHVQSPDLRDKLIRDGLLHQMARCLPSKNAFTISVLATATEYLSQSGAAQAVMSRDRSWMQTLLRWTASDDRHVRMCALRTLGSLTGYGDAQALVASEGKIDVLWSLVTSGDVDTQKEAARTLVNLPVKYLISPKHTRESWLRLVIGWANSGDPFLQVLAIRALTNLASEGKDHAVTYGWMADMLSSFMASPDMAMRASVNPVLADLASAGRPEVVVDMWEGWVEPISHWASSDDDLLQRQGLRALADLAMFPEPRRRLVKELGASQMLMWVARQNHNLQVRRQIARAIANLASDRENQQRLQQDGWTEVLGPWLADPDNKLQSNVIRALANLAHTAGQYEDGVNLLYPHPLLVSTPHPPPPEYPRALSSVPREVVLPPHDLDVVFVHGLRGGPFKTWRKEDQQDSAESLCWPRDWLPEDLKDLRVRVISVGYKGLFLSSWFGTGYALQDLGRHVLNKLVEAEVGRNCPVVFVTHSMGGLVVKQMLRLASDAIAATQIPEPIAPSQKMAATQALASSQKMAATQIPEPIAPSQKMAATQIAQALAPSQTMITPATPTPIPIPPTQPAASSPALPPPPGTTTTTPNPIPTTTTHFATNIPATTTTTTTNKDIAAPTTTLTPPSTPPSLPTTPSMPNPSTKQSASTSPPITTTSQDVAAVAAPTTTLSSPTTPSILPPNTPKPTPPTKQSASTPPPTTTTTTPPPPTTPPSLLTTTYKPTPSAKHSASTPPPTTTTLPPPSSASSTSSPTTTTTTTNAITSSWSWWNPFSWTSSSSSTTSPTTLPPSPTRTSPPPPPPPTSSRWFSWSSSTPPPPSSSPTPPTPMPNPPLSPPSAGSSWFFSSTPPPATPTPTQAAPSGTATVSTPTQSQSLSRGLEPNTAAPSAHDVVASPSAPATSPPARPPTPTSAPPVASDSSSWWNPLSWRFSRSAVPSATATATVPPSAHSASSMSANQRATSFSLNKTSAGAGSATKAGSLPPAVTSPELLRSYKDIFYSTRGVVFYGVPHKGTPLADTPRSVYYVVRPSSTVETLRPNHPDLLQLNSWYVSLPHVHSLSFGEGATTTLASVGSVPIKLLIVPMETANPGCGRFVQIPDKSHINICKPSHTSDLRYTLTLQFIRSIATAAGVVPMSPSSEQK